MSRVLVTGAEGFTGRYLTALLADRGYEVHGFGRAGDAGAMPGLAQVHAGDLGDARSLERALAATRPQFVVHLAAIAFVGYGDAREIYDSNLIGSRNLLQAIVDAGLHPSAVLLASSANVYGNQREGPLDESVPPEPANDYAVSKLAMEMVARLYADRLPIIIVRPFNYTGVGQSTNFLIPKIVDHARRKAPSIELGNLDVSRDFSDVRGVVDCYLKLLEAPAAAGRTFNVCSGNPASLGDVIAMVANLSGHAMEVSVNPAFVRRNEVSTLYGDNRLLREVIGEIDMPPLTDTLKWMLEA